MKNKKELRICNSLILNVAGVGPEPTTSGLWIRRSNQLSYPAIHGAFVLESGCKGMEKKLSLQILNHFFSGYTGKSFIFAGGCCLRGWFLSFRRAGWAAAWRDVQGMYRCAGRRRQWLSCKSGTGSGMPAGRSGRPGEKSYKNNERKCRTFE